MISIFRQRSLLVLLATLATLASACGGTSGALPAGAPNADKVLFDRGTQELNDKKWIRAREDMRQLVDNYPQSPYRADAKLGIGDSFLGEATTEALVLSQNEFREFLTFYPTHPRADYAQYKLGLAHFQQMRGPERDQTETVEAVKEFETFVERYPNSGLMSEVRGKLRESRDRLGDAEYRVGLFYYRAKWYPGAIDRLRALLKTDPAYTRRDGAYFYLAESLVRANRKAEALPYFELLVKEFESSEYLQQAQKRLEELKS